MTLDDLAAAVVGAEPTDLQGLARIHQGLHDLLSAKDLPDAADRLVAEAARCVEQVILAECADPLAVLRELEQKVAQLQGLCDSAMRPAETLAGSSAEPSETTASPAQALATPAPDVGGEPAARLDPPAPTTADAGAGESESLGSDPSLLAEFVTESREHLENAEGALLDLETNPENAEGINAIFRAFHTIKGTSGFLGLTRINAVAHKAETLLDRARKGEIRLAGGYADLALEATDVLKKLVEQVRSRLDGLVEAEPEGVDALLDRLDAPEEPAPAGPAPLRVGDILVARGQADRRQVEQVAAKNEPGPLGARLVSAGVTDAKSVADALRTQQQAGGAAEADATLRVSMARLDKLIDMVGELVIAQSMVSQDPLVRNTSSHALARKVAQSDKITRELQDLTLSMRMVPLKGTFQKMARLVRDLARKSGKQVRFVAEGEETEIDRNMVDA
ncbi:MAG TPA: Hpt domain-containing protein, partial [Phycisphaerae bacterium]|nr:Hpt domain-containing protein [Phycisphaerae bacterium]